jgi:hypothetical protein
VVKAFHALGQKNIGIAGMGKNVNLQNTKFAFLVSG